VGFQAEFYWSPRAEDVNLFAALSGDANPLHMDVKYAKDHGFDGQVVHGFLLGAQISGLIGMLVPGRRCLLVDEKLSFPKPVYIGDQLLIAGTVKTVHADLELIELKVSVKKSKTTVMRGQVTCKLLS